MEQGQLETIEHYEMLAGALTLVSEDGHAAQIIGTFVGWLRDAGITAAQIQRKFIDVMGDDIAVSAEKRRHPIAWGRCGEGVPHPTLPHTLVYDAHDGDPCRRCGAASPFRGVVVPS